MPPSPRTRTILYGPTCSGCFIPAPLTCVRGSDIRLSLFGRSATPSVGTARLHTAQAGGDDHVGVDDHGVRGSSSARTYSRDIVLVRACRNRGRNVLPDTWFLIGDDDWRRNDEWPTRHDLWRNLNARKAGRHQAPLDLLGFAIQSDAPRLDVYCSTAVSLTGELDQ